MAKRLKLGKIDFIPPFKGDDDEYDRRLKRLQYRLLHTQIRHMRGRERAVIAVEGGDAAGKGGFIARLVTGLEPRAVFVWRIGAPTQEELAQHYLWRFWRRLPAKGNWAVFDRTWYGRVLVERVEGLCDDKAWRRAYDEINDFERLLVEDGVRLIKILLHTSAKEQKERMIERLETPRKRYKIGLEDFRNIGKRKEYLEAFDDMLAKTNTRHAPWHVIATDDKKSARLAAMRIVVEQLGKGLHAGVPPLDPEVEKAAFKMWRWKPKAARKN
ncbi:MAG TPA: polyphosphate kinase [Reyranellaceae bacterium]|nr:polyphosphate kinase [Reyranellaceae bacterium]